MENKDKLIKVAIFDVCDTLYGVNTTFFFLDNYFEDNIRYQWFRKATKLFVTKIVNYAFYKTFKIDIIRLMATRFLSGEDADEVQRYSAIFVKKKLFDKENKNIVTMLNDYKEREYSIVLMSGAYEFIIKEIADHLGASQFFASHLAIVSNHYTGKFEQDILLNKHKILEQKLQEPDELIIVSDNKTDLELMKMADKVYVVCNKEKDCKFWQKKFQDPLKVHYLEMYHE